MKLPPAGGIHDDEEIDAVVRIMDRAMSLPIHHGLNADHMGFICEQLDALYDRAGATRTS